jgi:hypothetical protein
MEAFVQTRRTVCALVLFVIENKQVSQKCKNVKDICEALTFI